MSRKLIAVVFVVVYSPIMVDAGRSIPPPNITLDLVEGTSITVKWTPHPEDENFMSESRNFIVRYKKYQSKIDNFKNVPITGWNTWQATLTNLEEGTQYIIQVAATKTILRIFQHFKLTGDYSEPLIVTTDQVSVSNPLCPSPNVSLPQLLLEESSAVSIRRIDSLLIESEVILDCELSQNTLFTWSIYTYPEMAPLLSRNGSSEFRITPRMLPIGDYMIRLNVSVVGIQVSGIAQGSFQVTSSPLVALITGGTKVVRGFNRSLAFDASMSYDPDVEDQQSSGLLFTWSCTNISGLEGCYRTGGKIESNGSELTLNSGLLLENSSYFVNVKVIKDQRQAEYTQEVFIAPGDPPEIQIRCVDNCNGKLNPSGRIALQGICTGFLCEGSLTYKWLLLKATNLSYSNETQWVEITEIQQLLSTQLYSRTLVTYPRVLEADETYKFVLTAKRPGGYPGYSEYQVITNSPPTGGYCQVTPQSGITLVTEFSFSCVNWQDDDLPMQYEFIYFTNSDLLNVVYKGSQPSQHTKLPLGEREKNLTMDFRVRVADMFGAFTEVKTPVQVVEPTDGKENLVDIATNLTTGENSELTKLIQSGDLSRAFQLATAAIVAVDDNKQTVSQDLTAKRIVMKSSILQQMSAVKAETVLRVQQISNLIAEASSVISEVTVKAQETATDALVTMTSVLKAESLAGENYETILEGARSLVTGLGSILRVTSFGAKAPDSQYPHQDSSNYRRRRSTRNGTSLESDIFVKRQKRSTINEAFDEKLQSKRRTEGILGSLDDVGSTILSRTLVGEEPKELSAKSVTMLVARMEPDSLADSVLASKGNSFTLPPSTELFRNSTQFVDSQVITTDYVPFSWDASASRVTTKVSSLELKNSTGHTFNITDLKTPILISLANDQNFTNTSQSHFVGSNKTVYHRINVTTEGVALLLKIQPESSASEFLVYGKYNLRSSSVNSDFNKTIPDFSSCVYDHVLDSYVNCSRDPYMIVVDSAHVNQTGYYFIGITFKSRTSGTKRVRRCVGGQGRFKRSCVQYKEPPTTSAAFHIPQYLPGDENYTMLVIPAACLYWSTALSKWTTEGCNVAETSGEDSIHCSCNHLSAFGGQLFVAPNPIDFDKVVTEFSRLHETGNVAVIAAIGCVFGVYLLLLTWARKYDKLDHLKLGKRSLLGVRSPWAHFYEVEISTGFWRNSGTTAKVFVMLEGEQGTSRPYQLKLDSCIPFARGSVLSFTLSVPVDIGPIRRVRVWHDNSGSSPSWFLNYIKVFDVTARTLMIFTCYLWLAVDKGDGLVDRTLSSSTNEKGVDFTVYVQNRIAEEFSDEHLWFSVATRSPSHRFTRVERLSCCLSLLLCEMLVSAMFYQFDTNMSNTQGTIRLGRFVLDLREFIIAVQSLFIVLPLNLLIVMIFTHAKSTKEEGFAKNLDNQKLKFSLPHWCVYVAWLMCFLAAVGPATLLVFYSMQWGKDTSEQWLISIVISLFVEIFVSEPLRIIVVAFMLSHIFETRVESSYQTPYYVDPVLDVDDILLTEEGQGEEDLEIPKPPNKKKLQRSRKNRLRELHMFKALRKIVSYIIYLTILVVVCYGGRSEHGFWMTASVSEVFGNLNKISSHVSTWHWVQEVLVPGLFQDGKQQQQNASGPYVGDGEAVLVGMPRLRQLRVKKDSCEVPFQTRNLFNSCVSSYSSKNEDETQYYLPRWRLLSSTENVLLRDLDQLCPTAWQYASAQQTCSLHFWGHLYPFWIYGRGGYLVELGYDNNTASKVISELSELNWINRFTSVLFVEFTVFNPGVSLFSTLTIAIEFSPSGYVLSNQVIRTMHVYDLGGGYSTVTILCQVLLVFFIIYFIVTEVRQMILGVRQYFKQFLNLVELAQTVTVIAFVVTHVLKETELFENTAKLQENVFQFISFDKSVLLDTLESIFVSLLMFFNTLKLLYLLKFNSHVNHLFSVMKRSAFELLHCSLGLLVFMLTFIHTGYLSFGKDLEAYSSPLTVLQTLLVEGVIGEGTNYFQDCCILGRVYMLAFKLGLNFICINFFIAVLDDNYQIVKDLSKRKFNLGLFMIKKMKEMLGCVGAETEATIQPDTPVERKNREHKTKEIEVLNFNESILTPDVHFEERMKQINQSLNEIYTDEFGEDSDILRLWLDIRPQQFKDSEATDELEQEQNYQCVLA